MYNMITNVPIYGAVKYEALPLGGGSGHNSSIDFSPFSSANESCSSWDNREIRKQCHHNSTCIVGDEFCCLFVFVFKKNLYINVRLTSFLAVLLTASVRAQKNTKTEHCVLRSVHFRREEKTDDRLLRTDILACVCVCKQQIKSVFLCLFVF